MQNIQNKLVYKPKLFTKFFSIKEWVREGRGTDKDANPKKKVYLKYCSKNDEGARNRVLPENKRYIIREFFFIFLSLYSSIPWSNLW